MKTKAISKFISFVKQVEKVMSSDCQFRAKSDMAEKAQEAKVALLSLNLVEIRQTRKGIKLIADATFKGKQEPQFPLWAKHLFELGLFDVELGMETLVKGNKVIKGISFRITDDVFTVLANAKVIASLQEQPTLKVAPAVNA